MFGAPKPQPPNGGNQLDNDRLAVLINSLTDGFLVVDQDGKIGLSNGIALDLLDSNSLDGKNLSQALNLINDNGDHIDLTTQLKSAQSSFSSRDWKLKLSDNSFLYLFISVSPVRSGYGRQPEKGYVIILRDISREKNLETERDEFIDVASHELRTPVTIAEGSVSNAVLLAERSHLPDTIVHSLKSAHEQLVFLESLINDLAMLSRADRGKLAAIIEEVDATELVNTLVHDYQPQAAKKGLDLIANIDPKLSKITSSKLYLREIMQNFMTNAIKYTEKGNITVKAAASAEGVSLSVVDSGLGIDQNDQTRLFTKFFRSEDFRVRQISGTGLGLYVSAKLAKLLGGSITMTSQLNKGSTFSLSLPNSVYHSLNKGEQTTVA